MELCALWFVHVKQSQLCTLVRARETESAVSWNRDQRISFGLMNLHQTVLAAFHASERRRLTAGCAEGT